MKKIFFMLQKIWRDIFVQQMSPIGEWEGSQLNSYYFHFTTNKKKVNRLIVDLDENGVPLNTTYIDVEEKKLHYYPISIGQYALAVFHSWLDTKDEEKKTHFLRIADWFYNNRIEDNKLGVYWLTDVPKPEYNITKPWKSAFSQSRGLSILLRAWQLTNDDKYLETAKKALIPLSKDISEGGVTYFIKPDIPFYEEYVADKPTMVIAGHPFVLFGIYDFIRAYNNDDEYLELAQRLYNDGVKSLIHWLPKFDYGWWFNYNYYTIDKLPEKNPCTIAYLRLFRGELEILNKINKNEVIENYILKIKRYDKFINIVKMYKLKFGVLKKLNRL